MRGSSINGVLEEDVISALGSGHGRWADKCFQLRTSAAVNLIAIMGMLCSIQLQVLRRIFVPALIDF
jgi:hypothetical protein